MTRAGMVPWPADAAELYVRAGYWRQRPLGDLPWQWEHRHGERTALVDGARRLSFRELAESADALAERLLADGLADGDNLLLQLPNSAELVVLFLACLRIGVAPVMMLPSHRDHEMVAVARHAGVAAVAVPDTLRGYDHAALAERVRAQAPTVRSVLVAGRAGPGQTPLRLPRVDPAEVDARRRRLDAHRVDPAGVALFLLSGGSTGLPKLIARTHNDYDYNLHRSAQVCGYGPDTVYLVALPAGHNFPLGSPGLLGALAWGGTVVLSPSPSPQQVFGLVARERVTDVAAVPAVVARWVEAIEAGAAPDLSSMRTVQVGGSLFAPEAARQARVTLGCRVQQVYGMAEGLLNYTRPTDGDEVEATTQGRPISPHDEIRVVGADGRPVPPGHSGELLTRGPYTPRGYFDAAEHNRAVFTEDGFFRTGDLVYLHPSGNLVVSGRSKDIINRGGEKIAADEIERLVQQLPGVAEVAAVAGPDPVLGERICVYAVLRPGHELTLDQVRALFAAQGVALFKVPQVLEVVAELPHTPVGKIDKPELRRLAAHSHTGV
ncbi:AMP-binding protein [Catellatospora citrea]|uniref:(2,3-dihydroxybenzoyl)adenylate synthase n=1 Tax=Catellatospora citrea TaxID=53366 RepID=UPI00340C2716